MRPDEATVISEIRPVFGFTASYKDWVDQIDSVEEWRKAFFTLLSYKNSFSGFLELTILSTHDGTPYLYMVCDAKKLNQENMRQRLIELGYFPKEFNCNARFIDTYWDEKWDDEDYEKEVSFRFIDQ